MAITNDGITKLLAIWHLRFSRTFANDRDERAALFADCEKYAKSDEDLADAIERFAEAREGQRYTGWGQFMGFLRGECFRKRRRDQNTQTKPNCFFCNGMGHLYCYAPCSLDSSVPDDIENYTPGQPYKGKLPLYTIWAGRCWCADPEEHHKYDKDLRRLRQQLRSWWTAAGTGNWSLEPGEKFLDANQANICYIQRWARGDHKPMRPDERRRAEPVPKEPEREPVPLDEAPF